jgi:hypothetical protein
LFQEIPALQQELAKLDKMVGEPAWNLAAAGDEFSAAATEMRVHENCEGKD